MARPVFATTMLPLILTPFILIQVCHCSSRALLPPEVQQQQLVPTAPAAAHHRDEPPYHPDDAAETGVAAAIADQDDGQSSTARGDGDGAAPPSSSMATAASSPRDKQDRAADGVVASSWPHGSALLAGPEPRVLLRSKLARRFLVAGVVEGGDSAARSSCHSSDVHNGCTPPSEH